MEKRLKIFELLIFFLISIKWITYVSYIRGIIILDLFNSLQFQYGPFINYVSVEEIPKPWGVLFN